MSIVPEVASELLQYQQSTVTAGDDAKDAALCKSYICNAIRPKDIDKQVVPMPPGIKHSFRKMKNRFLTLLQLAGFTELIA